MRTTGVLVAISACARRESRRSGFCRHRFVQLLSPDGRAARRGIMAVL
jgi:hypothetical protein